MLLEIRLVLENDAVSRLKLPRIKFTNRNTCVCIGKIGIHVHVYTRVQFDFDFNIKECSTMCQVHRYLYLEQYVCRSLIREEILSNCAPGSLFGRDFQCSIACVNVAERPGMLRAGKFHCFACLDELTLLRTCV